MQVSDDQNACMNKWNGWKGIMFLMFWHCFPRRITHSTILPLETTAACPSSQANVAVSFTQLRSSGSGSCQACFRRLWYHFWYRFGIVFAWLQKIISYNTPRLE